MKKTPVALLLAGLLGCGFAWASADTDQPVPPAPPAPPALPAQSAQPAPPSPPAFAITVPVRPTFGFRYRSDRTIQVDTRRGSEEPFALLRPGENNDSVFFGRNDEYRAIRKLKGDRGAADVLWFQRNGKNYLVEDPAYVSRVAAALKPLDALSARMSELNAQMSVHGKAVGELSKQMQRDGLRSDKSMNKIGVQMAALGRRQGELSLEIARISMSLGDADNDAQRVQLKRQMEVQQGQMRILQTQMDAYVKAMDEQRKQVEGNGAALEAMGRKIEEASKPMEALGMQMEAVGRQQEAAVRAAEPAIRAIADEALAKGKASPL